jgi:hypothetical protein
MYGAPPHHFALQVRIFLQTGDNRSNAPFSSAREPVLKAITIIRPETVVRWHRAGFRRYWRWKSRCLGGRLQINADLRALIRFDDG